MRFEVVAEDTYRMGVRHRKEAPWLEGPFLRGRCLKKQSTRFSTPADPATNRLSGGWGYDANGTLHVTIFRDLLNLDEAGNPQLSMDDTKTIMKDCFPGNQILNLCPGRRTSYRRDVMRRRRRRQTYAMSLEVPFGFKKGR